MSVMDKLINAMKFNDDEDFDEDEEYEDEDYYGDDKPAAAAEPVRSSRAAQTSASFDDLTEDEEPVPAPRTRCERSHRYTFGQQHSSPQS